jgi:hypothetical protein
MERSIVVDMVSDNACTDFWIKIAGHKDEPHLTEILEWCRENLEVVEEHGPFDLSAMMMRVEEYVVIVSRKSDLMKFKMAWMGDVKKVDYDEIIRTTP